MNSNVQIATSPGTRFVHYKLPTISNRSKHCGVSHDIQQQVARYVTSDLKLLNSYDTWHGKFIHCSYIFYTYYYVIHNCRHKKAKELSKITKGLVKERGKKWHPELSDKRMC